MDTKLIPAAAVAAVIFLLPLQGRAQTFITYTDNAGNYSGSYAGQGGSTPGFGAFNVVAAGSAGTFLYTATNSEGGNGSPAPKTIDTPATATSGQPQSFGLYANNPDASTNSSVVISRAFNIPTQSSGLVNTGDAFSLDFVTGDNNSGNYPSPNTSGVELTNTDGGVGSFIYVGGTGYEFNGVFTGQTFAPGALHLDYTLTSPTSYSLMVTGALNFTGTGTFSDPITGFEVQQSNAGFETGSGSHDAYFNNLDLTAAPEPAQGAALACMGLGLGGLLLRRRGSGAD